MTHCEADRAICAFHEIERGRRIRGAISRIPAVARLGVAFAFLLALVSAGKYDLTCVASLAVYPFALWMFEGVPVIEGLARFWYALIPVALVGAANPFFDRTEVASLCGAAVTGGWLSFAVLCLKGVLALAASWSLLRLTGAEGMAQAFASLRLPPSFGFAFLLMHRYLVMMVKETSRMRDAYQLRSGAKGAALRPAAWGPFVGLLLMRSLDRARTVQDAAELRGGFSCSAASGFAGGRRSALLGFLYFAGWTAAFVALRCCEPMRLLGDAVRGAFA